MSAAPYVFKRGAVYWWRRRLPNGTDSRALVPTEISLNTKELHEAKKIAADVTQASERLLPLLRDKMISAEDAKKILVKVALAHSAKLDAVAANEIAYGADVESSRRADIATGWAYRLLAAHGKNACIGEQEVRDMRAAGLDDGIIVQTQQTITSLRAGGAFPPVEEKILICWKPSTSIPPMGIISRPSSSISGGWLLHSWIRDGDGAAYGSMTMRCFNRRCSIRRVRPL